jgi:hypothetical protein
MEKIAKDIKEAILIERLFYILLCSVLNPTSVRQRAGLYVKKHVVDVESISQMDILKLDPKLSTLEQQFAALFFYGYQEYPIENKSYHSVVMRLLFEFTPDSILKIAYIIVRNFAVIICFIQISGYRTGSEDLKNFLRSMNCFYGLYLTKRDSEALLLK